MSGQWKRIASRSMRPVDAKASSQSKAAAPGKKAGNATIHAKIQRDVDRIKQLAADHPRYRPDGADVPELLKLIRAAVVYANSLSPTSKANNFIYHGRRYPLIFTTMDRVIVCDKDGNKIVASDYDAVK